MLGAKNYSVQGLLVNNVALMHSALRTKHALACMSFFVVQGFIRCVLAHVAIHPFNVDIVDVVGKMLF